MSELPDFLIFRDFLRASFAVKILWIAIYPLYALLGIVIFPIYVTIVFKERVRSK